MKNLLIIAIIAGAAWQLYNKYNAQHRSIAGSEVVVFTADSCGEPCNDMMRLLNDTGRDYEVVDLSDGDEAALQRLNAVGGGRTVPVLMAGDYRVNGFNEMTALSALVEVHGTGILPNAQREAFASHFDAAGNAKVIMYGVEWCGYCAKARKYFDDNNIAYTEWDVEKNRTAKEQYDSLKGGGYPLIYIGARRLNGFNSNAVAQAVSDYL